MPPALSFYTLYPPIAAATVVNVLLFAAAWHGSQIEKRRGKTPWQLAVDIVTYAGSLVLFLFVKDKAPLFDWLDLFGAVLIGEAMGGLVVYAILHAFIFSCGQPTQNRVFAVLASGLLLPSCSAVSPGSDRGPVDERDQG